MTSYSVYCILYIDAYTMCICMNWLVCMKMFKLSLIGIQAFDLSTSLLELKVNLIHLHEQFEMFVFVC